MLNQAPQELASLASPSPTPLSSHAARASGHPGLAYNQTIVHAHSHTAAASPSTLGHNSSSLRTGQNYATHNEASLASHAPMPISHAVGNLRPPNDQLTAWPILYKPCNTLSLFFL